MSEDTDKFVGEWQNDAGNILLIEKQSDQMCTVSLLKGSVSEPILRFYYENKPSIDMNAIVIDHGSTLEVDLWEKGKGFTLQLTHGSEYDFARDIGEVLYPALTRYSKDKFLDQYYDLFGPLYRYVKNG
jgi:hypothetical protein